MSQENVEIVRAFATFDRTGDFAWSLIAPDADLVNAPGSPFTNASGHQGFRDSQENVRLLREMYGPRTIADAAELMHLAAEMRQPSALPDKQTVFHVWTFRDGMSWRCEVFMTRGRTSRLAAGVGRSL